MAREEWAMSQQAYARGVATQAPPAGTWTIDQAHSSIVAVATHMMVAKTRGHFGSFSGTLHVGETPQESWVEVTIDAATIDTGVEMRDNHLRSADFLDVETHPTITFRSTQLEVTGDDTFRLHGDLTIRGVTRPVVLEVEYQGMVGDSKGSRAGFSATGEIDRESFGMTWNKAIESGGVMVGRRLKVELEVEAIHQASEVAA
jgi:polyisoprenoid-binding protein YceI